MSSRKTLNGGKQISILYRNGNKTYLTFGIYSSTSISDKSSTVLISDDENVICFNSVPFPEHNISIVDCIKNRTDYLDNYFYYIDTVKLNVLKTVRNSMYYPFTKITRREMLKMKSPYDGNQYLIRSYFSDGVEPSMSEHAYAEIYSAKNPLSLIALKIIDKFFLYKKEPLKITMVKTAKGNFYLLDDVSGLFEIKILNETNFEGRGVFSAGSGSVFDYSTKKQVAIFAKQNMVYETNYRIYHKYPLLGLGKTKQVLFNDRFVIVLTSNSNSSNIEIFRIGVGPYSNTLNFTANLPLNTFIYLHKNSDILQIVSESKITLHQLNLPKLTHQFLSGREGTIENVTIVAQSKWPNSTTGEKCEVKYQLKVVSSDDQIVLKSNYQPTKSYMKLQQSLKVNLNNYFYGANISYGLTNSSSSSSFYIQRINQKILNIEKKVQKNIMLKIINENSRNRFVLYYQTNDYKLNGLRCAYDENNCNDGYLSLQVNSKIYLWAFKWKTNSYGFVFVQENKKNQVKSSDPYSSVKYNNSQSVIGIATSKDLLYVLKSENPIIDVFQAGYLRFAYTIDITNLLKSQSNVLNILSDQNHEFVLFVRLSKSILVIDTQKLTVNRFIAEIQIKQTSHFFISNNKLITVSNPNVVTVYSLDLLMRGEVSEEKKLSLYGNNLYSLDNVITSSRSNGLLYVPTVNPKNNLTSIFIYKLNTPAAISLYASIDLPKTFSPSMTKISVETDYEKQKDLLIITNGNQTLFYDIYNEPKAVFTDDVDQQFQLTFSNSHSNVSYTSQTSYRKSALTEINFKKTKDLDSFVKEQKLDKPGTYSWNDRKWFEGNVLGYNYSCEQCSGTSDSKVSFRSHNGEKKLFGFNKTADFCETSLGSIILQNGTLIKLNRDFSIRQKISLPKGPDHRIPYKVISTSSEDKIVSMFIYPSYISMIYFYVTHKVGNKSQTIGYFGLMTIISIQQLKIEIVGDLLFIFKPSEYGGYAYFYDLSSEKIKKAQIDAYAFDGDDDLMNTFGYNRDSPKISGSHLVKLQGHMYRLYYLESEGGLFIVNLNYQSGHQVSIIKMTYEDLNVVLQQNNLSLPRDANLTSLTFVSSYSSGQNTFHNLLVGCQNYDSFIVSIGFDKNNKVIKKELKSVLSKVRNYKTSMNVKVSGDFVAFDSTDQGKHMIIIYDISNLSSEVSYSKRYLLSTIDIPIDSPYYPVLEFNLNKTQSQVTNGKSIGLVYWGLDTPIGEQIIHKDLELELKPGYKTGNFTLIPWKFNQTENINLQMTASASFPYNFIKGNLQRQTLIDQ